MSDEAAIQSIAEFSGFDAAPHDFSLTEQTKMNIGGNRATVLYIMVKDRIKAMRAEHRDWGIETKLLKFKEGNEGFAVFRARITVPLMIADGGIENLGAAIAAVLNQEGLDIKAKKELISVLAQPVKGRVERMVIAEGHASEYCAALKSGISFADMVQKTETTAIGRALAIAGYGTEDTKEFEVEDTRAESGRYPGVDTGTTVKASAPAKQAAPATRPVLASGAGADAGLVAKPQGISITNWALAIFGFEDDEKKSFLNVRKVMARVKEADAAAPFKDALGLTGTVQMVDVVTALAGYYNDDGRPTLADLIDGLKNAAE